MEKIKSIWTGWKKVAVKIGTFQSILVFSALYYLIIFPFGIIFRFFSDVLKERGFPEWEEWSDNSSSLDKMKQ